jgi:hypothetical protein
MNKGVEIILNRMNSHPEEFLYSPHTSQRVLRFDQRDRWNWIVEPLLRRVYEKHPSDQLLRYLPWLNDTEIEALHSKLMEIQRDAFTKAVMVELLTEKPRPDEEGAQGAPF